MNEWVKGPPKQAGFYLLNLGSSIGIARVCEVLPGKLGVAYSYCLPENVWKADYHLMLPELPKEAAAQA
jgi:hypothetical protein